MSKTIAVSTLTRMLTPLLLLGLVLVLILYPPSLIAALVVVSLVLIFVSHRVWYLTDLIPLLNALEGNVEKKLFMLKVELVLALLSLVILTFLIFIANRG